MPSIDLGVPNSHTLIIGRDVNAAELFTEAGGGHPQRDRGCGTTDQLATNFPSARTLDCCKGKSVSARE